MLKFTNVADVPGGKKDLFGMCTIKDDVGKWKENWNAIAEVVAQWYSQRTIVRRGLDFPAPIAVALSVQDQI